MTETAMARLLTRVVVFTDVWAGIFALAIPHLPAWPVAILALLNVPLIAALTRGWIKVSL